MKEYNKYETEKELLADINLALENLKEYLVKIDSPISKYQSVVGLQSYIKNIEDKLFKINPNNPFMQQPKYLKAVDRIIMKSKVPYTSKKG